ncbi:unnamed protein product, partial [Porites evermanni]
EHRKPFQVSGRSIRLSKHWVASDDLLAVYCRILKMQNNTYFITNRSSSERSNGTLSGEELPQGMKVNYQVISEVLPIAIVIVLTNSLVFYLFAKRKSLRTPTNCLLLSLSLCDFMTGFIAIPLFIIMGIGMQVWSFCFTFNNALAISAAYHILLITLERYFAIMKPFVHRQLTKKSMMKIALVVWLTSVVIGYMPYAWFWKKFIDRISYQKIQFGYITFCLTFVFLVPCILIVVSQVRMFKIIAERGRCALTRRETSQQRAKQDKKCLTIFALMAFIYLACWLPWFVLSLCFSLWFPKSKETNAILDHLSQVFGIFRFVTSVVNPVLYTFFKRDFLNAFKTLVLKKKPAVQNSRVTTQKRTL